MAFEGIKRFFSNDFETTSADDSESSTHYYANDYSTTKNAVIVATKNFGFEVINIDDKYKEIYMASSRGIEIIATITTISYYENAVDMKITTKYLISMGRGMKLAKRIYEQLNRLISLKRKGGVVDEYNL